MHLFIKKLFTLLWVASLIVTLSLALPFSVNAEPPADLSAEAAALQALIAKMEAEKNGTPTPPETEIPSVPEGSVPTAEEAEPEMALDLVPAPSLAPQVKSPVPIDPLVIRDATSEPAKELIKIEPEIGSLSVDPGKDPGKMVPAESAPEPSVLSPTPPLVIRDGLPQEKPQEELKAQKEEVTDQIPDPVVAKADRTPDTAMDSEKKEEKKGSDPKPAATSKPKVTASKASTAEAQTGNLATTDASNELAKPQVTAKSLTKKLLNLPRKGSIFKQQGSDP